MWQVECGKWNVEWGNVECGMWNVECGMWNVESEINQHHHQHHHQHHNCKYHCHYHRHCHLSLSLSLSLSFVLVIVIVTGICPCHRHCHCHCHHHHHHHHHKNSCWSMPLVSNSPLACVSTWVGEMIPCGDAVGIRAWNHHRRRLRCPIPSVPLSSHPFPRPCPPHRPCTLPPRLPFSSSPSPFWLNRRA